MNEPKSLRLDEQHPELHRLFAAARAQEPTPEAIERMVRTVNHSVTRAAIPQPAKSAREMLHVKHSWTARAAIVTGALGFAAGALAAGSVGYWAWHGVGASTPASRTEASIAHQRVSATAPANSGVATPATANAPSAAPLTQTSPAAAATAKSKNPKVAVSEPAASFGPAVLEGHSTPRGTAHAPFGMQVQTPVMGSPPSASTSSTAPAEVTSTPAASVQRTATAGCSTAERSTIDRSRDALVQRGPVATLELLNGFEQRCQFKAFAPEALQLRMRAQAQLGQLSAAIETARRLSERFSNTAPGQDALHFLNEQQR